MEEELRHIVRIVNTDLQGKRPIVTALMNIKGVSYAMANSVCTVAGIDKNKKTGLLSSQEIEKLNTILKDPLDHNIPKWLLNRRKDYETGSDKHVLGVDLRLSKEADIKRMQVARSYKGMRHAWRLPVRGQRTRSNFRPNKGKVVGVKRRKGAKSGRV